MIMWQDILKGAVANILIDWVTLSRYENIEIYEEEDEITISEYSHPNKMVENVEVKYSIGVYRENDGIKIKFHSGVARVTIEGQVIETEFEEFNIMRNDAVGSVRFVPLVIEPKFLSAEIIKGVDGEFVFRSNRRIYLGLE
tara:strand:+ start:58 stop:480 length:423 start_codon:yes stop_codon:yes gene_type:complete